MAQKIDPKKVVNLEDIITSTIFEVEVVVNLLHKKGIISKEEILVKKW